jgi:undecaprenyl-diphosphatase
MISDLNVYLFGLINGTAGKDPVLDGAMIFIAGYLVFVIPVFLIYLWFKGSKTDENKKEALFVLVSVLTSLAIAWGTTLIYFHPRPFMIGLGTELVPHAPETSFPSDHATAMFSVAFSLIFLKEYKKGVVFFILSLLVGLARIFCGIHFPFDIIGSVFVSLAGAGIVFTAREKLNL